MAKFKKVRQEIKPGKVAEGVRFYCLGCKENHVIYTSGSSVNWAWNGDVDRPTLSPSINYPAAGSRCHSFVSKGMQQYLGDCDHALAGQTVEIPDIESRAGVTAKE